MKFLRMKRQFQLPLKQSNSAPDTGSARAARRATSAEAGRRTIAAVAGTVVSVVGIEAAETKRERGRRRGTDS